MLLARHTIRSINARMLRNKVDMYILIVRPRIHQYNQAAQILHRVHHLLKMVIYARINFVLYHPIRNKSVPQMLSMYMSYQTRDQNLYYVTLLVGVLFGVIPKNLPTPFLFLLQWVNLLYPGESNGGILLPSSTRSFQQTLQSQR